MASFSIQIHSLEHDGVTPTDVAGIIKLARLLHPIADSFRVNQSDDAGMIRITLHTTSYEPMLPHPKLEQAIWELYRVSASVLEN